MGLSPAAFGLSAARTIAEEVALIERVCAGQRQVFAELIRPYKRSVYFSAFAILRNSFDAEDVAQETFIKAYLHLNSFRGEAQFKTWLIQIAMNEARTKRRQIYQFPCKSIDGIVQGEEDDYGIREIADSSDTPSELLQRRDLRRKLRTAMSSLRPAYRDVFVLRDIEDMSIVETAKELRVSQALVKTRLFRARLKMRAALTGHVCW
jgi:RNA polymerase sigma-70 factor (ECF subfamily)